MVLLRCCNQFSQQVCPIAIFTGVLKLTIIRHAPPDLWTTCLARSYVVTRCNNDERHEKKIYVTLIEWREEVALSEINYKVFRQLNLFLPCFVNCIQVIKYSIIIDRVFYVIMNIHLYVRKRIYISIPIHQDSST